jgi:predicted oxidoreductase
MTDDVKLIALEYLLEGSTRSLQNAMLHRLANARNLQKDVEQMLEKWAESQAEAMLLAWFLKHGEELAGLLASSKVTEIKPLNEARKPGPVSAVDFRDRLKNLLESA